MKTHVRPLLFAMFTVAMLAAIPAGSVRAEEANCAACHEQLVTGKTVHAAVAMGCATCHSAIDPAEVPHTVTNRNPKGLAAKMKDLCFNCHDREPFKKSTVHGALRLGCTTCHNPHATDHASILKEDVPRLCLNCHEEGLKQKKDSAHPAAGNEACSVCHQPHASDSPNLVRTQTESSAKGETALIKKNTIAHQ